MALWGKNGRPRLNVTPKPEFSRVGVDSGPAWHGLSCALQVMSEGPDAAGKPPYRVETTLVREDGGRELVHYDGLGDGSWDARAWPVMDCIALDMPDAASHGDSGLLLRLPAERVAGPGAGWAAAAAVLLERRAEALAAAASEADAARSARELLDDARRLNRQLAGRAAWIRERLNYISEKLWAFDDMMRAWSELEDVDTYTAGLKKDYSASASALKALETAEELERRAGADAVLLSPAARVGWDVEDEISALLDTLDDAEEQAVDAEARQSRAQARLAAAKAALAGLDSELGAADAQRCSRLAAVQAASLAQSIEQRRQRIDAVAAEAAALPRRGHSFRLGKTMTLSGVFVVATCLTGIVLAPGDAMVAVGALRAPLPAALLAGLAAGLLLTVFGLAEGMEVQAGIDRRARLESDLVNLTRQQSWAQLQLRTLLGGRDLEDYMTALARQDELETERQERAAEVAAALGQVMTLRNQVDYVRTTITRARERLTEVCRAIGAGTPEAFLTQADQCAGAMKALESAALEVRKTLGGSSRWSMGIMPKLLEEEILAAEAMRAVAAARVADSSKLAALAVEHEARLMEQQRLTDELKFIEAQLEEVGAELAANDVWECTSRQVAAEAEAERLRGEAPALALARQGLVLAAHDMVQAACTSLEEPATEVMQFMCENREVRVSLDAVDGQVRLGVEAPHVAAGRLSLPDLAILGALAVDVAAAEMRAARIRPLVVLAPYGTDSAALKAALRRLSLTRQVILMVQSEAAGAGQTG